MERTIARVVLCALFFLVILGGVIFLGSAIRGLKPASRFLSGKSEPGEPLTARTRIGWGVLGLIMIFLGTVYLFSIL